MPAWTEEANFQPPVVEPAAPRPRWEAAVSIRGVPWLTIGLLAVCGWVLFLAGGIRAGVALPGLLMYGAKATPLILDRGETWRLLTANVLHKDLLHLAFNAFAIWNVGGALERAVRPADYLTLLVFTALGTTLCSAVGSDSISLGASGIAFGVLGASAAFGWRRGVRGPLRSYFGLRIVPWLLALFAAGVGSAGVDNWGHAGGLVSGAALGAFLAPRAWPGEGSARRLAAACGAVLGTLALGVLASPALPALGPFREGPQGMQVRMPLGWRQAGSGSERMSFANGLTSGYRSTATLLAAKPCRGHSCECSRVVRAAVEDELWRLADLGPLRDLHLAEAVKPLRAGVERVDGVLEGTDGEAQVSGVCVMHEGMPVALVVLQPPKGSTTLVERMAGTLRFDGAPAPAPAPASAAVR